MARTGYKVTVYLDDNPDSPTYGQTYEERVYDTEHCPIEEDDLVLVGNECEIGMSGYTGYRLMTYYNRTTGEYVSVREEDAECEPSSTEEQWVNSGSPFCETTEQGLNTGYMLQLQVQMNQALPSYGTTRYSRYKSPDCALNSCASWDDIQSQCHISVSNCVATFDGTEDVTQIDVNPLSETYNTTRTINREDTGDCQNCTETTFSWVEVGEMCGDNDILCAEGITENPTSKYLVERKYKTIGSSEPVAMGEYRFTLVEEDVEDCGYIPPQYKWEVAQGQFLCDYETYTKYQMEVRWVSYDSGVTWSVDADTEPRRGAVIAEESYDCGKPMYKWVPTDEYVCVDNGDDGKIIYINSNGKLASATPCSVSSVLVAGDGIRMTAVTQDISLPYTDTYKVGNCINEIGENAFSGMSSGIGVSGSKLHLGDYTEIINAETLKWYDRRSIDFPRNVNTIIKPFDINEQKSNLRNLVMNCSQVPSLSGITYRNPLGLYGAQYGTNTYGLAIWVPNDLYDEYCSASGWINYAGRDNCKLMPMNNDNISYKVIEMFESDFTRWSYFIPDGENSSTVTADECRYGVSVLTSITFTDKVTSFSVIPTDNYNKLVNLKEVNFSESLTSIPSNVFRDCPSLTRVDIPNSVKTIGSYAFYGCSSLRRIEIGSGVKAIRGYAFGGCGNLTRLIVYASTPPTMENGAFSSSSLLHIYVPAESVDLYKSASGWSSYSDIITAITI